MRLTTREKAKLYDALRSMARFESESHGYHNGFHQITFGSSKHATPENFTTALKAKIREDNA